jgi:hypothetical protein
MLAAAPLGWAGGGAHLCTLSKHGRPPNLFRALAARVRLFTELPGAAQPLAVCRRLQHRRPAPGRAPPRIIVVGPRPPAARDTRVKLPCVRHTCTRNCVQGLHVRLRCMHARVCAVGAAGLLCDGPRQTPSKVRASVEVQPCAQMWLSQTSMMSMLRRCCGEGGGEIFAARTRGSVQQTLTDAPEMCKIMIAATAQQFPNEGSDRANGASMRRQ